MPLICLFQAFFLHIQLMSRGSEINKEEIQRSLRDQNEKGKRGINNELNKPRLKIVKKEKIKYIFSHINKPFNTKKKKEQII